MAFDNEIWFSPALIGHVTAGDLLQPGGLYGIQIERDALRTKSAYLFRLRSGEFEFSLAVDRGTLRLTRGTAHLVLTPDLASDPPFRNLMVSWSTHELTLTCDSVLRDAEISRVNRETGPVPASLLRFARSQKLLPSTVFRSEEDLRAAVHHVLADFESDVGRLGGYNAFWDVHYEVGRIVRRLPKRETDIHPTIHQHLADWASLRSIEIIPENQTGVGNLDFAFLGHVDGQGPTSISCEVKHGHSDDLLHGLDVQLPAYMERKRPRYGVYLVLWFRGDWFDRPTDGAIERLSRATFGDDYERVGDAYSELTVALTARTVQRNSNIRVFVFDLSKPPSASSA
jgi:hypothetical protein